MKIVNAAFEFITEQNPYKKIEICGRTCYKSEDKITANSAEKFVAGVIKSGHESVLEHAEYIIMCDTVSFEGYLDICKRIECSTPETVMLRSTSINERNIISGNVRMWRDFMRMCKKLNKFPVFLGLFRDRMFLDVNPIPQDFVLSEIQKKFAHFIEKSDLEQGIERLTHMTETVRFVCDRGISHEIVRHRKSSFSQESSRYCNYGKAKFGNEITVIKPCFWDDSDYKYQLWEQAAYKSEEMYFELLSNGATPQEARSVLPNSLKTELVMTTNIAQWRHFLYLRTPKTAHPQMRELAIPLLKAYQIKYPYLFDDIVLEAD